MGLTNIKVGQARQAYCCQIWNCGSFITGCVSSYRRTALLRFSLERSFGNLAECMPITTNSRSYFSCIFSNWGNMWRQLIQQYVQKSRTTSLPRNSLNVSGRVVLIHSAVSGNSGAFTCPEKDSGIRLRCVLSLRSLMYPLSRRGFFKSQCSEPHENGSYGLPERSVGY